MSDTEEGPKSPTQRVFNKIKGKFKKEDRSHEWKCFEDRIAEIDALRERYTSPERYLDHDIARSLYQVRFGCRAMIRLKSKNYTDEWAQHVLDLTESTLARAEAQLKDFVPPKDAKKPTVHNEGHLIPHEYTVIAQIEGRERFSLQQMRIPADARDVMCYILMRILALGMDISGSDFDLTLRFLQIMSELQTAYITAQWMYGAMETLASPKALWSMEDPELSRLRAEPDIRARMAARGFHPTIIKHFLHDAGRVWEHLQRVIREGAKGTPAHAPQDYQPSVIDNLAGNIKNGKVEKHMKHWLKEGKPKEHTMGHLMKEYYGRRSKMRVPKMLEGIYGLCFPDEEVPHMESTLHGDSKLPGLEHESANWPTTKDWILALKRTFGVSAAMPPTRPVSKQSSFDPAHESDRSHRNTTSDSDRRQARRRSRSRRRRLLTTSGGESTPERRRSRSRPHVTFSDTEPEGKQDRKRSRPRAQTFAGPSTSTKEISLPHRSRDHPGKGKKRRSPSAERST